jgi:predicted RNA-binding protein with PUA-like domain
MAKWLVKTEPSDYSIDDLQIERVTPWNGIRNFQARNFIRDQMSVGDEVLIYHSSCTKVGVAGIGRVVSDKYADKDQFDSGSKYYDQKAKRDEPKWFVVDIEFVAKAPTLYPLKMMKQAAELQDFALFKQSRLSVMPVTQEQWQHIFNKIQ